MNIFNTVPKVELLIASMINIVTMVITYYAVYVYHVATESDQITAYLIVNTGIITTLFLHITFFVALYFFVIFVSKFSGIASLPLIGFTIFLAFMIVDGRIRRDTRV